MGLCGEVFQAKGTATKKFRLQKTTSQAHTDRPKNIHTQIHT